MGRLMMRQNLNRRRAQRGVAVVYMLIAMTALFGLVSLAVDYGRAQLVKTELQRAADAAARVGAADLAMNLPGSIANDVLSNVRLNHVEKAVLPDNAIDCEVVQWNSATRTYQRNVSPGNAVMVTLHRTAARGNAVPLLFAGLIGMPTCDVKVSTIVTGTPTPPQGFQGLNGVTFKNNVFIGSYDPTVDTAPTEGSAGNEAILGSNAAIDTAMHVQMGGNLILGPAGSVTGSITSSAATQNLSNPIPAPTLPAWNPSANPSGVPQSYTVSSNTVLGGGTYWFTSLTISADLSFSGPATVIVNGNVVLDATLTAYNKLPANLVVYQLGTGRTFGDSGSNTIDITARVIAPGSDFVAKNNGTFRGSGVFNTLTLKNNWDMFYDTTLGPAAGGQHIEQVR
jgi:Flp pilus assembly protein TadG